MMKRDDKATQKRAQRAERARRRVQERRRFNVAQPATGELGKPVPPGTGTTIYPKTVREPQVGDDVLTDCANQVKIGGRVLIGDLAGANIYGLTLEERVTCPTDCSLWSHCYGNGMPFSTRWEHGKGLEMAVEDHVRRLVAKGPLLVRLHILGDFYSYNYLLFWARLLDTYDDLHTFGFTAWKPTTEIGQGVARLREVYPRRFAIRHSGILGAWGSATIDFPTEKRFIGDAVVCPEQLDANSDEPKGKHCGNCAVCWQTDRAVVFIEHGKMRRKG